LPVKTERSSASLYYIEKKLALKTNLDIEAWCYDYNLFDIFLQALLNPA
jgi:hypothetical protein